MSIACPEKSLTRFRERSHSVVTKPMEYSGGGLFQSYVLVAVGPVFYQSSIPWCHLEFSTIFTQSGTCIGRDHYLYLTSANTLNMRGYYVFSVEKIKQQSCQRCQGKSHT